MNKDEYREYLNSEEWFSLRDKVLEYFGHRCAVCDCGFDLDVHHRTYARAGREDFTDLIALCRECHSMFHNKLPKFDPVRLVALPQHGPIVSAAFERCGTLREIIAYKDSAQFKIDKAADDRDRSA